MAVIPLIECPKCKKYKNQKEVLAPGKCLHLANIDMIHILLNLDSSRWTGLFQVNRASILK